MENIFLPRKQNWSFQKAFCCLAEPISYMTDDHYNYFETHMITKRLSGDKLDYPPLDITHEVCIYLWTHHSNDKWFSIMQFKDGRWGYFEAEGDFAEGGKMSLTITYRFKRLILEAVPDDVFWLYYNETDAR